MSFINISLSTPAHLDTMKRLMSVMDNMSSDYLNKLGAKCGFDADLVASVTKSEISLSIDEGVECFVVSVEFIDKHGDTNGVAFVFVGSEGEIVVDFPY